MEILREIKEEVIAIEPEAEIYLFGSRARGTHSDDSDWDVLILLPETSDYKLKKRILEKLYDIEIKFSSLFNIIFRKFSTWRNDKVFQITPFYQSVVKDYKKL